MISRLIISIILLPILFFSIYINVFNYIFLYTLIFFISLIANFELSRLFRKAYGKYLKVYEYSTYVFNFLLIYFYFIYRFYNLNKILPILLPVLIVFFSIALLIIKKTGLKQIFLFIISFAYTGLIPLLIVVIRYYKSGNILIYMLFTIVWVNDASALFIGSKFGKIKGLVKYSPNKSLEGYIGSFLVTLVVSIVFKAVFLRKLYLTFSEVIIITAIISVTGHLGDVLESAIKRKANVKDSSGLFLGLGGILDIFDSVIASVPFYFFLLKIFYARG